MTLQCSNLKLENGNQGLQIMRMEIMSAICAQCRLCECQQQLILPSVVLVFNIFIYLLKLPKSVNSL